ncbi:hypothetical protein F0562_003412 [Nyssa sinensis]|uniref:Uncharacterized protein n=1 Tax=Nyssa sinensis TaxID=561372 RepID=A0A5J5BV32_9ASTE|nr:hypothetical protein F0562_003412 [Nyssa sinensis]
MTTTEGQILKSSFIAKVSLSGNTSRTQDLLGAITLFHPIGGSSLENTKELTDVGDNGNRLNQCPRTRQRSGGQPSWKRRRVGAALGDVDEADDIGSVGALIMSGNGRALAAPLVAVSKSWLTTVTRGRAAAIVGGDILLNSELDI